MATTAYLRYIADTSCSLANRGQRNAAARVLAEIDLSQETQTKGGVERRTALADLLFLDWRLHHQDGLARLEQSARIAVEVMWDSPVAAMIVALFLRKAHQGGNADFVMSAAVKLALRDHMETDDCPKLRVAFEWLP